MLIELLIYCFMLIELMLIVSVDEFHWNWLNYMLLLRCVDLGMKLIMWLLCELLLRSDYEWLVLAFDWFVESCELHVFDGNELVVLNGWLICGKPRKKKWWDWKHMLYDEMRNWAMWNCTKWLILKKMPRKGKD